jgi:hypothetical protein
MVEAGATLIVGNHPHRVQGLETFPSGAVAVYALGNFIFDQKWSDNTQYTQEGMLLSATFSGSQLQAVQLLPIHISDEYQPQLAPLDEGREILREAAEALNRQLDATARLGPKEAAGHDVPLTQAETEAKPKAAAAKSTEVPATMAAARIGKTRRRCRRQYRCQQYRLQEPHLPFPPADGRNSNELLDNLDSKVTTIVT